MCRAGIAHKHGLFLDSMISLSVSSAWVDRMLIVKAAAHRVALNNLITHGDGCLVLIEKLRSRELVENLDGRVLDQGSNVCRITRKVAEAICFDNHAVMQTKKTKSIAVNEGAKRRNNNQKVSTKECLGLLGKEKRWVQGRGRGMFI